MSKPSPLACSGARDTTAAPGGPDVTCWLEGGDNDGMRRFVPLVVVLGFGLLACSGTEKPTASRAFCKAADNYDNQVERARKRNQQGTAEAARQAPLLAEMARTAPRKIRADAQTFADAMQRRADGDNSVIDDPDIERAADNVNRFANQACNVYQRDSGI